MTERTNEHVRNTKNIKGIVLIIMLMGFSIAFSFVAGYYWSRRTLAEDFLQLYLQDELSDKVSAAFYARDDESGGSDNSDNEESDRDQEPESSGEAVSSAHDTSLHSSDVTLQSENALSLCKLYQAILIGFGEARSAERYISKLARDGIEARVVKRTGKNRRGREVTWYQVVTKAMTFDEISQIVLRLKKSDRLEGVMITEVEMG